MVDTHDIRVNPGRGFYKLFYIEPDDPDIGKYEWVDISQVSLVLLVVDIACARNRSVNDADMDVIRSAFDYFIKQGKRLILRFSYDHDGRGMMREPDRFAQVLEHAAALAGLIREYKDHIFVYQGLLVGDWGEMHSTKYADGSFLEKIYDALSEAGVDIAVRKPAQQGLLPARTDVRPILFNDGLLADEIELGTIRSDRMEADEQAIYDISGQSPYGGEMVYGSGYIKGFKPDDVAEMMKKRHITYLNMDYDTAMYDHLRSVNFTDEGFRTDVFSYLSVNLGYRFAVKKVLYRQKKLTVYVTNKGFSKAYVPVEMRLVSKNGESLGMDRYIISDIIPGETECFSFVPETESGEVYICANTTDLGEKVFFSNPCDENGYVFAGSF